MDSETEAKTLGVDEDPHANLDAKATLQTIIWNLMQRHQGEGVDPVDVEAALSGAIAEAGLPEQPKQWVEATAIEIAGGREVVMDVKDQVEPEQVDVNGETVNVLGVRDDIPDPASPVPTAAERDAE